MEYGNEAFPVEDDDPLHRIDLDQDEVLGYIGLLARPFDMDNETAIRHSVAGLYTPTNSLVISVLDRLAVVRAQDFKTPDDYEKVEGDFLTDATLAELNQFLKGVDGIERQVELTRVFMKSKHRVWAHRQRMFRRRDS